MKERAAERSAACRTCGKTFARSDTLLRHEKSHLATEDRGPVHRVTSGTFRACCACALARSRCSGGEPCGRCKVRNLECTYPSKRRKVTSVPEDHDQKPIMVQDRSNLQPPHRRQTDNGPGQFQEIIFAHDPESSYPGSGQLELTGLRSKPEMPAVNQTHRTPQLERQMSNLGYNVDMHHSMIDAQQQPQTHLNASAMSTLPDHVLRPNQYQTSLSPNEVPSAYPGLQTNYEYDAGYDDSLSLNWIPLSLYDTPYGDIEQDFSFLLPTFSDTASLGNGLDSAPFDVAGSSLSHGNGTEYHYHTSVPERANASASALGFVQSPASSTSEGITALMSVSGSSLPSEVQKKRRKMSHVQEAFTRPKLAQQGFGFPDTSLGVSSTIRVSSTWCNEDQYNSIRSAFEQLCVHTSRHTPYTNSTLIDNAAFNTCVQLYVEEFHPTFPLLHVPSIGGDTHWIVLLAMAAIGSNFASLSTYVDLRDAFHELLRRAILDISDDAANDTRIIHIAQARILNLISLTQSDRLQTRSSAPRYHAELSRWCLESGILQLTAPDQQLGQPSTLEQKTAAWHVWIRQESQRRTGYFIWFLDCAFGYLCNARPLCNMDDVRAPLPCQEVVWNASTAELWFEKHKIAIPMPSLCAGLEEMYSKKKVDPSMSELSTMLLVHALYSRTWEVGTHIKQPLAEWKATGNARGFLNTPSKDNFWLPLYPLYANWRNSACDCLDVLHWQANEAIAKAAGSEPHSVLHLHLARIILLTPFQEIQDLLFFLIDHDVGEESKASFYVHDGSYQRRHRAKLPQIRKITWRWLREDQHKARLAMVHAGSVFWHVRRYSSNSFFEPLAVYLASIVLWTYGSYKSAALEREAAADGLRLAASRRPSQDGSVQPTRVELAAQSYAESRASRSSHADSPHTSSKHGPSPAQGRLSPVPSESESDDQDQPTFIHLDRPCDDEIVQHFVRNGHNMSGHMSNVGDICTTPQKVLVEGAKLLKGKLGCWGISREYYDILIRLAERGTTGNGHKHKATYKGKGVG